MSDGTRSVGGSDWLSGYGSCLSGLPVFVTSLIGFASRPTRGAS